MLVLALVPQMLAQPGICEDTCGNGTGTFDLTCDDGGPGAAFSFCEYGTDCHDCGRRELPSPPLPPLPPPSPPPPRIAQKMAGAVGWQLDEVGTTVSPLSLIDVAVDILCLCLLLCAVVPLLRWRLASRRKSRYVQLAAGGGSSLELGSVPHTTVALRNALSDGSTEDTESLQLVVLDHHAHQQLVESQRLVGDRLGELTAELRTLQSQPFPPEAKSGDRVTALAARQRTFQAGAALPAPEDEVAVVALETGKSV